ncbi:MAG TPA: acetate--CoA ligase family protein [Clostridia bacterium]|nr:acetate--CoA ligase family protein [Clostridia bacterium]
MADLTTLFNPGSIAVVGASAKQGKIGNAVLKNIIESNFKGNIFPVNPKATKIENLKNYPSLQEIPEPVDLAIAAVPAKIVPNIAKDCGKKGVKSLIVLSAGFKEVGQEGLALEKDLVNTCQEFNINLLGPNSVGMIDTHTPLNASFGANFPKSGDIAFLSQSGAMLVAILDWSKSIGLGFSKVISLGNKAALSETDFIKHTADDPNTSVILCYIEDISNGENFLNVVSEATKKKPVIIFKSGASRAGARAASSHTGALAGSDLAYDTAFRQCGVIRARSMTELFDLAVAFSQSPLPQGDRVAVITNARGPGIIASDSIEQNGLIMSRFEKETIVELQTSLPPEASVYNPVDVLGDAKADRYRFSIEKVADDPNVDSIITLLCPTAIGEPLETSKVVIDISKKHPKKSFMGVYMGGETLHPGVQLLREAKIPCFTFPETAINTLKGMSYYRRYSNEDLKDYTFKFKDIDSKGVKATFYDVIKDNRLVLLGSEAADVAQAYGIPATPIVLTKTPDEAVEEAGKLGYPVVLKVASPKIIHKTDVGGVKIGLQSPDEVRSGFSNIMESVHKFLPNVIVHGIEVQKLMPKGTELIIGLTRDIQFGPLIAFGLGGIYVNLLKDVSFRLAHGLNYEEIEAMIAETKAYSLLRGYRGEKPADMQAIIDTIARVAKLSLDFPEITEMDINPVFAYNEGLSALDVKITIS